MNITISQFLKSALINDLKKGKIIFKEYPSIKPKTTFFLIFELLFWFNE